jgi:hypothetical protein
LKGIFPQYFGIPVLQKNELMEMKKLSTGYSRRGVFYGGYTYVSPIPMMLGFLSKLMEL